MTEVFDEIGVGFADAGGVVHLVACNQQCHCHAMVGVCAVLCHSSQAVGFLQWQGLNARSVQFNTQAFTGECDSGIEVGAGCKILF